MLKDLISNFQKTCIGVITDKELEEFANQLLSIVTDRLKADLSLKSEFIQTEVLNGRMMTISTNNSTEISIMNSEGKVVGLQKVWIDYPNLDEILNMFKQG